MIARKFTPVPIFIDNKRHALQSGQWLGRGQSQNQGHIKLPSLWVRLGLALLVSISFTPVLAATPGTSENTTLTPSTPTDEQSAKTSAINDSSIDTNDSQPSDLIVTEAAEPPRYSSRLERDQALLALAEPEEVRWLNTENGKVLALFRPTATRVTKGVLLLFYTADHLAGFPPALENARLTLAEHGWATLALTLPTAATKVIPERDLPSMAEPATDSTETSDPNNTNNPNNPNSADTSNSATELAPVDASATKSSDPANANDSSTSQNLLPVTSEPSTKILSRAELIEQSLAAAFTWLVQENLKPVVLLVDNSSVLDSLTQLENLPDAKLSALILLNLDTNTPLTTTELASIFSIQSPPILDVFFAPNSRQTTDTRQRHKAVALRNQVVTYQQLHLASPALVAQTDRQTFWVERLRGFMERKP